MATYFGYVKREADSYINWADFGNNMVKMLGDEMKLREQKQDAFEKDAREKFQLVADNPMGQDKSANEASLTLASQATGYLQKMYKEMKAGRMSLRDWKIKSQNLFDSTKSMYNIMKMYGERAKQVNERNLKGESQPIELQVFANLDGMANFKNTYTYIDETTGKLWVGKKEKATVDGKEILTIPSQPTEQFQPTTLLEATMNINYDKYNLQGRSKEIASAFGVEKFFDFVKDKDTDITYAVLTSDPVKKKGFDDALKNLTLGEMTNPYHLTSILTQYTGESYSFTPNIEEAKKDPNKILYRVENNRMVPDFESTQYGKEQHDKVYNVISNSIKAAIDQEKDIKFGPGQGIPVGKAIEFNERDLSDKEKRTAIMQYEAETGRYNALKPSEEEGDESYVIGPSKIPSYVEYLKGLGIKGATSLEQYDQLGNDLQTLSKMGFGISYPPSENTNGKYTKIEISEPGGGITSVIDMESPFALNQIKAFLIGSLLKKGQNELNK